MLYCLRLKKTKEVIGIDFSRYVTPNTYHLYLSTENHANVGCWSLWVTSSFEGAEHVATSLSGVWLESVKALVMNPFKHGEVEAFRLIPPE